MHGYTSKVEKEHQNTKSALSKDKLKADHQECGSYKDSESIPHSIQHSISKKKCSDKRQDFKHEYDQIPGDKVADIVTYVCMHCEVYISIMYFIFFRPISSNPHNLAVGSFVKYLDHYGVIRWIGTLLGDTKVQAGVEMVNCDI